MLQFENFKLIYKSWFLFFENKVRQRMHYIFDNDTENKI